MFISQDGADFCILQIQIKNNYLILFGKDIKENSCEMIIHATQAHLILHSVRVVDETKVARRAIGFSVD